MVVSTRRHDPDEMTSSSDRAADRIRRVGRKLSMTVLLHRTGENISPRRGDNGAVRPRLTFTRRFLQLRQPVLDLRCPFRCRDGSGAS